ncbi:hypothetical protein [Streptomyces roseolus]|uniref:hypothetical protein n=1 Tax=Streptomyces roseolus TaxID=67358 RepID=UPI001677D4F7|nr:hypothetical protein [Streptomyces roseolus]GGR41127.1 hypothetical protein GCM10010282_37330 [Streptomyces roseolus]
MSAAENGAGGDGLQERSRTAARPVLATQRVVERLDAGAREKDSVAAPGSDGPGSR